MIDYLDMVKEYHLKYNCPISISPQRHDTISVLDMEDCYKLIAEEFQEFGAAETREDIQQSLANLLYAVFRTCLVYGVPINDIFTEIHRKRVGER